MTIFSLREGSLWLLGVKRQAYAMAQPPENGSYGPFIGCGNLPFHEHASPPTPGIEAGHSFSRLHR